MAIRGDTTAGAGIAHAVGMHLRVDLPDAPNGSDPKSAAIHVTLNAIKKVAETEIITYNTSVDELRRGLTAAPQRVDATDQQGATEVNNSRTRLT
ncbi:MAG TPA: hypothetical protein VHY82_09415 [Acetobacteraceae bacterium]|jgi:hypothetical protein|nr:hypothetical protein [Acetobacteraceae bacterium]